MKETMQKLINSSPVFFLCICLIATILVATFIRDSIERENRVRFNSDVNEIQTSIQRRMERYENVLISARSLVLTQENTTRKEFREFVEHMDLDEKHPGVQGIGLALKVDPSEFPHYERKLRNEGFEDFNIWPLEPKREAYFPIIYLEPLDWRNKRALGYDMYSETIRRAAMKMAMETGKTAISDVVTLVQETPKNAQAGFLMYLPIKGEDYVLRGFVYAPFRANDLFFSLFNNQRLSDLKVNIEVFDGKPSQENLLFDSNQRLDEDREPRYYSLTEIPMFGRPWNLYVSAGKNFTSNINEYLPLVILFLGSCLSFIFYWFSNKMRKSKIEAENLARELNTALEARDEFLSIASHELKSPMTSMKLQAQMNLKLLLRGPEHLSFDRVEKYLKSTNTQIDNLTRLVEDMLDISRINLGKLSLFKEKFNLSDVTNEVVDRFFPDEMRNQLILQIEENVLVEADRFRIEQVLTNLISNAIKYGDNNPISILLETSSTEAIFTINDQGIGIAEDNLERIFLRFERAISSNQISGLGLGLYIVKHILKMHDGSIQVKSRLEEGSTFIVSLPVIK